MTTLFVSYKENPVLTERGSGKGPYRQRDCYCNNAEFNSVSIVEPEDTWNFQRVTVDYEVTDNTILYVAWANYGTGDSFGRTTGQFECVGVFLSKNEAVAALKDAKENSKNPHYYTLNDYFGGFEAAYVDKVQISENYRSKIDL